MLFKALLLLGAALAATAVISYVYFAVNMQAGDKRFGFTLLFTGLLSVPLVYHLVVGDYLTVLSYKTLLMLYIPAIFLWSRVDLLKRARTLVDDEDLL
ncbi:MAG: hypothetical protein KH009_06780 [Clostridiales bacterium]|nr:hypothetical protein [Clostridiales bacterium]